MEIKAKLDKPYTEKERCDFIVEQNHNLGYEIRETETVLEAWGSDENELFEHAKADKQSENTAKCHEKLAQGSFILEIDNHKVIYFYDNATQNNLNSAALGFLSGVITQKEWTDENGSTVYLSQENIAEMLLSLESWGNPIWAKWGKYKKLIEEARSIKELNCITVNYDEGSNGL